MSSISHLLQQNDCLLEKLGQHVSSSQHFCCIPLFNNNIRILNLSLYFTFGSLKGLFTIQIPLLRSAADISSLQITFLWF